MALAVGSKVGAYEILAPIGAGGMGEVYRARDTKLKRDVALKVLPEVFATDAERMARFQREAEVLASLNHPNIAHIYGVEDRALVMELVEGDSPKGPLPFEEAWHIASQIAAGLEYAHEKGIVHRDLKPGNIKITPDGIVKLLDFGLAKAFTGQPGASGNPENSPTLTLGATQLGVILGTAAYMAPEQAKGKTVDKRADIWSFGVVLYELLTGERLFTGDDVSDTLAQVLMKQSDLDKVPVQARQLLRACLDRDPKKRLRDIGDAERQLVEQAAAQSPSGVAPPSRFRSSSVAWIAVGVMTAVAATLALVHFREEAPRVQRFSALVPENARSKNGSEIPQISPDGRRIVMPVWISGASTSLWLRDLDSVNGRILPGTDGATIPFWSPDSRWVGFFADNKLKKIDVTGGPALTLCDAAQGRGGSWNQDDVIVYGRQNAGLSRVPAAGGTPVALTEPDAAAGEASHRLPWFLPDGRHFLYTARSVDAQKTRIYVDSIEAKLGVKTRKEVQAADSNAVYVSGYVLFVRERTLMAQPFDASKLQTTGDAVPIAEQVDYFPGASISHFSVSKNGALVYTTGAAGGNKKQLTWFDRNGKSGGAVGMPADTDWARISPDGSTVASDRADTAGARDIWLHDLARGTDTRFTFGNASNAYPVWSGDGSRIAFTAMRGAGGIRYVKAANGVGAPEVLDKDSSRTRIDDWSRDGRYIIAEQAHPKAQVDIWVVPQFGDKKPFPYLNSEFAETNARLSPNSHWLAYMSNESKRNEVYVQTFPEHGGKWQISTSGGNVPVWSADGRELYFVGAGQKLMAVEVKGDGKSFQASVPKPLFEVPPFPFDVSKDGRFLIQVPVEQAAANVPLTLVVNWQAGLKK